MTGIKQLSHFTYQQAMSCLFPAVIFLTLALSKQISWTFFHRYDFILLVCLAMQVIMLVTGLETKDELKVILLFHLLGLLLELFKVQSGSWSYPEPAWSKVAGVPLYSGFMYASVASYLCQAWRRLRVQLIHWPKLGWTISLATLIYLNFFTHHYIVDLRWGLMGALVLVFFRSHVRFVVSGTTYRMPQVLSYFLIGFFIWVAENIATYFGAWQYPYQREAWQIVDLGKLSSWFLLVIVSFIIVAQLKQSSTKVKSGDVSSSSLAS
ncbi:DUF817 domain-containing protein [Laceyella putida]|uniref:DUF817 domain-containing protein n=1 Tax=Laceyella putida TaxID=110101 RepID=A0ABW2RLP9_9BACL